jgi:ribose transport system substrate-binding protein
MRQFISRFCVFAILLAGLLTNFLAAGCSTGGTSANIDLVTSHSAQLETTPVVTGSDKLRIALIMKTLTNPFFVEMEKGARKAELENKIELIVKTGAKETSIEQQINIVDEMISQKVDAIVIAPGSSTDLVPILKKAQDAHIPIVNIDNRLDAAYCQKIGLKNVPFISVDNEKGAYQAVKILTDQVTKPAKAIILEGISNTDNSNSRVQGAKRAFAENSQIQLITSMSANWKIDEANEVARQL